MYHFNNFNGFGISGTYLSHSNKSTSEVARGLLSTLKGKEVRVVYNKITNLTFDERKYEPHKFFEGHLDWLVANKKRMKDYLNDVVTDNILINFNENGKQVIYEVQRIVIGKQSITEVRQHFVDDEKAILWLGLRDIDYPSLPNF